MLHSSASGNSRPKIVKYHQAIQRGRHPRSFPHQTQLWQFVEQSKQRLGSVKSGQPLPSLLIAEEAIQRARVNAAATSAADSGHPVNSEPSIQSAPAAIGSDERSNPPVINAAMRYVENYESSEARKEKVSRRLSLFRQRKHAQHLLTRDIHPDIMHSSNTTLRGHGAMTLSHSQPHLHNNSATIAVTSDSNSDSAGPLRDEVGNDGSTGKRMKVASMARGSHLKGGARRLRTMMVKQASLKRLSVVGSMLNKAMIEQGAGHRRSVVDFMVEQHKIERKEAEMQRHIDHERLEEQEHESHLQQAAALAHINDEHTGAKSSGEGGEGIAVLASGGSKTAAAMARLRRQGSAAQSGQESFEFTASDDARIFYQSRVAFELVTDGSLLSVLASTGEVFARQPQAVTGLVNQDLSFHTKDKTATVVLFTLMKLDDPEYAGPVRVGDDVYLAVASGPGSPTWKSGSVLGAKVMSGAALRTVGLDPRGSDVEGTIRNPSQINERIGHAGPVKAYVPQSGFDRNAGGKDGSSKKVGGEMTIGDLKREGEHNKKIEATNRLPLHTGRWRICAASNKVLARHALKQRRLKGSSSGTGMKAGAGGVGVGSINAGDGHVVGIGGGIDHPQVHNGMQIYLEQDWFMLSSLPHGETTVASIKSGSGPHHGRRHLNSAGRRSPVSDARSLRDSKATSSAGSGGGKDSTSKGGAGIVGHTGASSAGGIAGANGEHGHHAVVLRQLPNRPERGETVVDRKGVWRIRLVQTGLEGVGDKKGKFHTMEQLLYKARKQLRNSESVRDGGRHYDVDLHSGTRFPRQIRRLRQNIEEQTEDLYLTPEEDKDAHIREYFECRYEVVAQRGASRLGTAGIDGRRQSQQRAAGERSSAMYDDGMNPGRSSSIATRGSLREDREIGDLSNHSLGFIGHGGFGNADALYQYQDNGILYGGSSVDTQSSFSSSASYGVGASRPWTTGGRSGMPRSRHVTGMVSSSGIMPREKGHGHRIGMLSPLRESPFSGTSIKYGPVGESGEDDENEIRSKKLPFGDEELRTSLSQSGQYVVPSSPAGGAGVKLAHSVVFKLRQNDTHVAAELQSDKEKSEDRMRRHSTLQLDTKPFTAEEERRVAERERVKGTTAFQRLLEEDVRLRDDIEYKINRERFSVIFGSVNFGEQQRPDPDSNPEW